MLKERHRYGVRVSSSRGAPHRNVIAPPEVGIIPGNRFFLLPLKKVSALVRHHDYPCCGASATSIKTCIEPKAPNRAITSNLNTHTGNRLRSSSNRSIVRQRRRHPAIARTHLGPISEQEEATKPLLDDPGNRPIRNQGTGHVARIRIQNLERAENVRRINTHLYFRKAGKQEELKNASLCSPQSSHVDVSTGLTSRNVVTNPTGGWSHNRRRSKGTSIFSLDHPLDDLTPKRKTGLIPRTRFNAERELIISEQAVATTLSGQRRGKPDKKKVRSLVAFGRNRVLPSDHPSEVFCEKSFVAGSVRDNFGRVEDVSRRLSVSRRVRRRDERNESSDGCSGVDQTRWSTWRTPFVCSLTDEKDLPIDPLRGSSLQEQLLKCRFQ